MYSLQLYTQPIKWYKYWERWKSEYLCFIHSTIRWPLTYTLNCFVSFSIKIRMMQQIETTLWISDNSCDRSHIWKHFDRAEVISAPVWFQLIHEYRCRVNAEKRKELLLLYFVYCFYKAKKNDCTFFETMESFDDGRDDKKNSISDTIFD